MKFTLILLSLFTFSTFANEFITVPNDIVYTVKNGGNEKFEKRFFPGVTKEFVYSQYGVIENSGHNLSQDITDLFGDKKRYLRVSLKYLNVPMNFKLKEIIIKKGRYAYQHHGCGVTKDSGSDFLKSVRSQFQMHEVIFHLVDTKGKVVKLNEKGNRVFFDGQLTYVKEEDGICSKAKDLLFEEFFNDDALIEYRNLFK